MFEEQQILQLVKMVSVFRMKLKTVLMISEAGGDSSQVGSAQRAEFKSSQQRGPSVTWKDTEPQPENRRPPVATISSTYQCLWNYREEGHTFQSKLRVYPGHLFNTCKRLILISRIKGTICLISSSTDLAILLFTFLSLKQVCH